MLEPYKIHFNHNDNETSDSGNSDFDEEYFRFQPPPIVVSPQDVIIIKALKKTAGNNKNVKNQEASYNIPQNIATIKRGELLKATAHNNQELFGKSGLNKSTKGKTVENVTVEKRKTKLNKDKKGNRETITKNRFDILASSEDEDVQSINEKIGEYESEISGNYEEKFEDEKLLNAISETEPFLFQRKKKRDKSDKVVQEQGIHKNRICTQVVKKNASSINNFDKTKIKTMTTIQPRQRHDLTNYKPKNKHVHKLNEKSIHHQGTLPIRTNKRISLENGKKQKIKPSKGVEKGKPDKKSITSQQYLNVFNNKPGTLSIGRNMTIPLEKGKKEEKKTSNGIGKGKHENNISITSQQRLNVFNNKPGTLSIGTNITNPLKKGKKQEKKTSDGDGKFKHENKVSITSQQCLNVFNNKPGTLSTGTNMTNPLKKWKKQEKKTSDGDGKFKHENKISITSQQRLNVFNNKPGTLSIGTNLTIPLKKGKKQEKKTSDGDGKGKHENKISITSQQRLNVFNNKPGTLCIGTNMTNPLKKGKKQEKKTSNGDGKGKHENNISITSQQRQHGTSYSFYKYNNSNFEIYKGPLIRDDQDVSFVQNERYFGSSTSSTDLCVTTNWDSKNLSMLEDEEASQQTFNVRVPKSIHQSEPMHNLTFPELVQAYIHDRKLLDYPINNYELLTETYSFNNSSLPRRNKKKKSKKNFAAIVDQTVVENEDTNSPPTPSMRQNDINNFSCTETTNWTSKHLSTLEDEEATQQTFNERFPKSTIYQSEPMSNLNYAELIQAYICDQKFLNYPINNYELLTEINSSTEKTHQIHVDKDDTIGSNTTTMQKSERNDLECKEADLTVIASSDQTDLSPCTKDGGTSSTTMPLLLMNYDTTHTYCHETFNGLQTENEQYCVIVQNKQESPSRDLSVNPKGDSYSMSTCEVAIGTYTSNDPTLVEKPKSYVDIDMTTTNQTTQTKSQKKKKNKKKKSSKLIYNEETVAIDQLRTDFCSTPNWVSKDLSILEDEEASQQTFDVRVPKSIHQSEPMHNLTFPELVQAYIHDRKLLDYPINNYELLTETYSFNNSSLPRQNKKKKSNKNAAIVDQTVVVSSLVENEDTNRTPTLSMGQNDINNFSCTETSQFCYNIADFDVIPKQASNEYQSVRQNQKARNLKYMDYEPVSRVLNQEHNFRNNCSLGAEETCQFNADDESTCSTTTHQIITKQLQREKRLKKRKTKTELLKSSVNELEPVMGCELSTETYSYNPLLETSGQFYLDYENTICFKPKFDQSSIKKSQIENMKEKKNKTESIYDREDRFGLGPLEYLNIRQKNIRQNYPGEVSVLQNQPGIEHSRIGCFSEDFHTRFHISSGDQQIQFSRNRTKAIKNELEIYCTNHTILQNTDSKMDQDSASGSLDDNYKSVTIVPGLVGLPNEAEHAHFEPNGHSIINRCSELILKVYQLGVVHSCVIWLIYSFFKKE